MNLMLSVEDIRASWGCLYLCAGTGPRNDIMIGIKTYLALLL